MTALVKSPGALPMARTVPSSETRGLVLAGFLVIGATFGGFGGWAAVAPIDSAAIAPGSLVVESQRKVVQHLEGGIVSEILVQEGDPVTAGQVLVRLDSTQSRASTEMSRKQRDFAMARQARLTAEKDGLKTITFAPELLARRNEPEVVDLLASEERLFLERTRSLTGQIALLQERIAQSNDQIRGMQAQRKAWTTQTEIMGHELVGLKELLEKGWMSRTRVLEMERNLAGLKGQIGSADAQIAQARNQIGEAEMQMRQREQEFREKSVAELGEVEKLLSDLTERLSVSRDMLKRTDVLAPQDGHVQRLAVHTVGGVVRPGESLMEIVPQHDRLIIEAQISPLDISGIAVGQETEVRFSALKSRTTPVIFGTIDTLSADRITDTQRNQVYYLARIVISDTERTKLGDQKLQAGMPADAVIKTGERTLLEYLIKPMQDSMAKAITEH